MKATHVSAILVNRPGGKGSAEGDYLGIKWSEQRRKQIKLTIQSFMEHSEKIKIIVQNLSPQVQAKAGRVFPYEQFFMYADAVLKGVTVDYVEVLPDTPADEIQNIVLNRVVMIIEESGNGLISTLKEGGTQGRVQVAYKSKTFLIDINPEY